MEKNWLQSEVFFVFAIVFQSELDKHGTEFFCFMISRKKNDNFQLC